MVSSCRNLRLLDQHLVADRAVLSFGLARHLAGCGDCRVGNLSVSLCEKLFCSGRMTDRAGKGLYALVFAGRFSRDLAVIPMVSRCRNLRLLDQHLVTDRAVLAFGLTRRLAGRGNCRVCDLGVSLCGNFGLRGQNLVTDRTMLSFGLTGSLAGCGDCRVDYLGMPCCRNSDLLDQLLPADRAVLAFRLARRLAGRGDRRVYDLRVSRCRNLGLHDQHLMADRTMLAFRFAGHFAARCDRRVCHLCMPCCRNFCLRDQYLSANRAMLAFRLARRFTGCGNRRVCHGGMPLRRNRCRLDQHLSANRAMLAFGLARFLAGCRNSRVSLHDVTYCGQIPLRLQRLIADRAVRSVTPARLGTGRRLAVVNDLRVSLRRQNLLERECPHTHGAVHALAHADGNAGRLHARQGNQGMIRQRYLFLCLHDCSARTAMGAFRQPLLHTGCRDGGIGHHGVSGCRNCFLFNPQTAHTRPSVQPSWVQVGARAGNTFSTCPPRDGVTSPHTRQT